LDEKDEPVPSDIVKIAALSRTGLRIIATVVTHIRSTHYRFVLVNEDEGSQADIAIVDDSDPEMRQAVNDLLLRNPALKVIYLLATGGQTDGRRNELLRTHLVSHLMPLLEQVAKTMGATHTETVPGLPAAVPKKIVQLVTRPRPDRLRALVVDDNPTVRLQLVKVIERMGLECDTAEGGEAALQKLAQQRYHIIYVDVVMPDMDGYKLTREIKRNRDHKSTPVVILTSKSSPFDRARGALAGCDTYLTKPVELKRLFEATSQCLRKGRAVSDLSDWISDPALPALQSQPQPLAGLSGSAPDYQAPASLQRLST
jgi:two-component system, cell cycle response regulator